MLETLTNLFLNTGFFYVDWRTIVMWLVVFILLYLAVFKQYEPLLLVPIAFGALLANLPTLGILNNPSGPVLSHASGTVEYVFADRKDKVEMPRSPKVMCKNITDVLGKDPLEDAAIQQKLQEYFSILAESTSAEARTKPQLLARGMPDLLAIVSKDKAEKSYTVKFGDKEIKVRKSDEFVWAKAGGRVTDVNVKSGQEVIAGDTLMNIYDSHSGGLFYYVRQGVLLEIFPPLIFLGVGALTDFGPLIANPKTLLLGAAAQFGIFVTFVGALFIFGFSAPEAASIGIIGGADGPTSIFTTNKLAPHLLGPIAVAAYSYMALVPVIQPPIMRLLTTEKERKIKMTTLRKVSRTEKLVFALIVTIFCIMLVPDASALIGMLMLGNFLRECAVTERLSKAAQNEIINIVTIFLGASVGITMAGDRFLTKETLFILFLGVVAFAFATAGGVCVAKIMNLFLPKDQKINPLIGSAGVSAVPMAARVSHVEGQKADPSNFLIMHAMGPNVAGVIGSAVAAGFFISSLSSLVSH